MLTHIIGSPVLHLLGSLWWNRSKKNSTLTAMTLFYWCSIIMFIWEISNFQIQSSFYFFGNWNTKIQSRVSVVIFTNITDGTNHLVAIDTFGHLASLRKRNETICTMMAASRNKAAKFMCHSLQFFFAFVALNVKQAIPELRVFFFNFWNWKKKCFCCTTTTKMNPTI